MSTPSRILMLSLLLTSPACFHQGELGYLQFELPGLVDPIIDFQSGDPLLEGSMLCPQIVMTISEADPNTGSWVDDSEQFRACFDETLTGPAQLDASGCLRFEGPGEVTWELTPDTCGSRPERLRFGVVKADASTQLGFDAWQRRAVLFAQDPSFEVETSGLAPGRELIDLLEAPGDPRRVFVGQLDAPLMRLDDANGRVYWTVPAVELELIGEGVEPVTPISSDDYELDEHALTGELPLRLEAGASVHVRARLPSGEQLDSPELIPVTIDDAASLDLLRVDSYLIADVRDAEGRVLHAAPIEWSVVEGALGIDPGDLGNDVRTQDYASFDTRCEPPPMTEPELRRATVRARLGALEDTLEIEWEAEPPGDLQLPWTQPDSCMSAADEDQPESGCGCRSTPTAPAAPALAGLALLAWIRRRRS